MPSLKDTKRRIGSVKNTQKITRAMKLVSSAKYARANLALLHAKPFFNSFVELMGQILPYSQGKSPLLQERRNPKKGMSLFFPLTGGCVVL